MLLKAQTKWRSVMPIRRKEARLKPNLMMSMEKNSPLVDCGATITLNKELQLPKTLPLMNTWEMGRLRSSIFPKLELPDGRTLKINPTPTN